MKVLLRCFGLPVGTMDTGDEQYFEHEGESLSVDRLLYLLSVDDGFYDELRASTVVINGEIAALDTQIKDGDDIIIARVYAEG